MSAVQSRPMGALGRMGVVVAAHGALVFILATSFGLTPKKAELPPDIDTRFVPDERPIVDDHPPPVNPELAQLDVRLPEPEFVPTDVAQTEGTITGELVPPGDIHIESGSAVPVPQIFGPRLDPRRPLTQPRYPDEMIRNGVEGAVDVEILVQTDGRIGDARIVKSSGYASFDQATLEEARRKWRMLPATRDGQLVADWYRLRVKFKLTNR